MQMFNLSFPSQSFEQRGSLVRSGRAIGRSHVRYDVDQRSKKKEMASSMLLDKTLIRSNLVWDVGLVLLMKKHYPTCGYTGKNNS